MSTPVNTRAVSGHTPLSFWSLATPFFFLSVAPPLSRFCLRPRLHIWPRPSLVSVSGPAPSSFGLWPRPTPLSVSGHASTWMEEGLQAHLMLVVHLYCLTVSTLESHLYRNKSCCQHFLFDSADLLCGPAPSTLPLAGARIRATNQDEARTEADVVEVLYWVLQVGGGARANT